MARVPSSRRGRWRPRILLILAVVALPFLAAPAAPTAASWTDPASFGATADSGFWLPWYGQLRLVGTTLCLDVPARTDTAGQALQLYTCNSTPAQIWFFQANDSNRVRVFVQGQTSPNDGAAVRCLQDNGAGQPVTIENCTKKSSSSQQWTVAVAAGGFVVSSGNARCLDVPVASQTQGTAVAATACGTAGRARTWDLEFVPTISYA